MTSIEHALLGAYLVLASGANRRCGWQLVAAAGAAAVVPDWDALPLLFSVALFDAAHRCWGHALVVCLPVAVLLAMLDYRFDCVTRLTRSCVHLLRVAVDESRLAVRSTWTVKDCFAWSLAAVVATLSHVFTDMLFSGNAQLTEWPIKILWPISETGFDFPMIPWGDVGLSVLFFLGLFAMLRWPKIVQRIAVSTLAIAVLYAVTRALL